VGFEYAVPRQLIKIAFARTLEDDADRRKVLDEATAAKTAADDQLKSIKAKADLCSDADTDANCARREKDLTAAKAKAEQAAGAVKTAKAAVSAGNGKKRVDTITVTLLGAEPDPVHRFFAQLHHTSFRDDLWSLGTTKEGLLTTSKSQPTDRTGDVILQIAHLAGDIGAFLSPIKSSNYVLQLPRKEKCGPDTATLTFTVDVADLRHWPGLSGASVMGYYKSPQDVDGTPINAVLASYCSDLKVGIRRDWKITSLEKTDSPAIALPQAGLIYRRPLPYEVAVLSPFAQNEEGALPSDDGSKRDDVLDRVKKLFDRDSEKSDHSADPDITTLDNSVSNDTAQSGTDDKKMPPSEKPKTPLPSMVVQQRQTVLLPNEAPFQVVAYPSGALTPVTQTVAFEDGYPKQFDLTRNSEALAFATLPVTFLGVLIDELPGRLFKFRINYDSAKEQELKNQKALDDAEVDAIKSKAALDEARKAAAAAAP
jgi:hypothetical protein